MGISGVVSDPGDMPTDPSPLVTGERRLHMWRRAAETRLRSDYPASTTDPSMLAEALFSGTPLVASVDPLPKPSLLSEITSAFLDVLAEAFPAASSLDRWLRELCSHPSRQDLEARWFAASWNESDPDLQRLADETGLSLDILAWAGERVAQPFFALLAAPFLPILASNSYGATPTCPCCGRGPRMGRYRSEDGRRFLWCSLCDLQWEFRRLTCPFCANTDPETLGYLTVEGAAGWRIDVCGLCGGYLRAADERRRLEGETVELAWAEVATLHLCAAAENAGYGPPGDVTATA